MEYIFLRLSRIFLSLFLLACTIAAQTYTCMHNVHGHGSVPHLYAGVAMVHMDGFVNFYSGPCGSSVLVRIPPVWSLAVSGREIQE